VAEEDALTHTLAGRVRFGPFEADLVSGELRRDGAAVPIQDLPFRLLVALLERPRQLVSRAELTAALWGSDTFVDATAGLNTAVAKLREALDDDADQPKFIETVPKRGYRFIGHAATAERSPSTSSVEPSPGQPAQPGRLWVIAFAGTLAAIAIVLIATFELRAGRDPVRVAVTLFDNETGDADLGRLAQGLTDATVTELTAEPRLAVIGNAAILRTDRPFRDMRRIADALRADYIVIGQVQTLDAGTIVRTHLIRAKDESHLWVDVTRRTGMSESALQSAVSSKVRAAVQAHCLGRSSGT
jgi:DNA-binding winged helix-turn-helix (wHTH) protein/TolB-like protein